MLSTMSDATSRLNAALEGRYAELVLDVFEELRRRTGS